MTPSRDAEQRLVLHVLLLVCLRIDFMNLYANNSDSLISFICILRHMKFSDVDLHVTEGRAVGVGQPL